MSSSSSSNPLVFWYPDAATDVCSSTFCLKTLTKGHRHHCRLCGMIFCDECCSSHKKTTLSKKKKKRVCNSCANNKNAEGLAQVSYDVMNQHILYSGDLVVKYIEHKHRIKRRTFYCLVRTRSLLILDEKTSLKPVYWINFATRGMVVHEELSEANHFIIKTDAFTYKFWSHSSYDCQQWLQFIRAQLLACS